MTPEKAALELWDVLRDIDDGIIDARAPIRLSARRNLIRAAGTVSAAADHLIEVVWEGDRSVEPPGWWFARIPLDGEDWVCERANDGRIFGFGKTRADAIAAAWTEHDRRDLYAIGARLCAEEIGDREEHGDGFVLLEVQACRPPGEDPHWDVQIRAVFGVAWPHMQRIAEEKRYTDLDFGPIPEGDGGYMEALCRVLYEAPSGGERGYQDDGGSWLEVHSIDGKPVIEVYW